MFTGLIEELGIIKNIDRDGEHAVFSISAENTVKKMKYGESVSVNGVCLTVKRFDKKVFKTDVMPETMRMSTLKNLKSGDYVNLERALQMGSRIGGHLVTGHIDGVVSLEQIKPEGNATLLTFHVDDSLMKKIVFKGSICLDGVSLTIADIEGKRFTVSIIPTTREETTLIGRKVGDKCNVECDVIGKYLNKILISEITQKQERFDFAFLKENGFI